MPGRRRIDPLQHSTWSRPTPRPGIRRLDRQDPRPLRDPRPARQRWHGRGLPRAEDASRWQAPIGGGQFPLWNPRGGELYCVNEGALYAVAVTTTPDMRIGSPVRLFSCADLGTKLALSRHIERFHDVMPDGETFVVVRGVGAGTSEIVLWERGLAHEP